MINLTKAWKKHQQICAKCDKLETAAESYLIKYHKSNEAAADLHSDANNEYIKAVKPVHGSKAKINWFTGEVESPVAMRLLKSIF